MATPLALPRPYLFYTTDEPSDPEVKLTEHIKYKGGPHDVLFQQGEVLLRIYQQTINTVFDAGAQRPQTVRIQNAIAAAVYDVPRDEFQAMTEEDLRELRGRGTTTLLNWNTAPSLVVYIGPKRGSRKHSTPNYADTPNPANAPDSAHAPDSADAPYVDAPAGLNTSPSLATQLHVLAAADDEYDPWDNHWNYPPVNGMGCAWGWHSRTNDALHHFIFISGAYALYPGLWKNAVDASENTFNLHQHLKVTLIHELIYGLILKTTPEKVVDHPSKVHPVKRIGEAGRYAEALAFGGVIDLYCNNSASIVIFTTDPSKPLGTADFQLDSTGVLSLFGRDSPFTFAELEMYSKRLEVHEIHCWRSKSCGSSVLELNTSLPPPPSRAPTPPSEPSELARKPGLGMRKLFATGEALLLFYADVLEQLLAPESQTRNAARAPSAYAEAAKGCGCRRLRDRCSDVNAMDAEELVELCRRGCETLLVLGTVPPLVVYLGAAARFLWWLKMRRDIQGRAHGMKAIATTQKKSRRKKMIKHGTLTGTLGRKIRRTGYSVLGAGCGE
ncbi:hypothetical protein MKEN_01226600 [Mycena kentingensis (nom. inval.)]|nr:hypothetical protein MKEN_01226600 [Mycena kentingensis (nom. inval.)]